MKLLDTNVVVYAVGRPHRYKAACARLLKDIADGVASFNIDTELLQEILYLYTARGRRDLGLATCSDLLEIFPNPFPITRQDIVLAHALMTRYRDLVPRDAVHMAIVLKNQLEGIVSADKGFDALAGLKRFDPLALYPEED